MLAALHEMMVTKKSQFELKKKLQAEKRQHIQPAKKISPTKSKSASSSASKAIKSGPRKRKRYRSNPEVDKWKNLGLRVGDKYEVWYEDDDDSQVYRSTIKGLTYSAADDTICNCRNCRTIWGKEGGIPTAAVKIEYKEIKVTKYSRFKNFKID